MAVALVLLIDGRSVGSLAHCFIATGGGSSKGVCCCPIDDKAMGLHAVSGLLASLRDVWVVGTALSAV
jgi:hypothetical protein